MALRAEAPLWASVFVDPKMTTALPDRLTHHCHIVETGNESYRFRHSSRTAKARIKAREQARLRSKEVSVDTTRPAGVEAPPVGTSTDGQPRANLTEQR